tara:strand:+ start:649 stop:1266 length:618 start_codon:yes stop_codon:yes gene_type:complete
MTSPIPAGENAGAAGDSGTLTSGGSTPGECIGGGVVGGEGEDGRSKLAALALATALSALAAASLAAAACLIATSLFELVVVVCTGANGFVPCMLSKGLRLSVWAGERRLTAWRRSSAALAVRSNGEDAVVDTSVDLTDMASSSSTASLWMNALASMSSERKDASDVSAWEKDTFAGDSGCADRFWPLTLPMLPWLGVGDPRAVPT